MGTEVITGHGGEGARKASEASAAPSRRREVKDHIRALIERGALRRGSRLPSILELSRTLEVAKNTVIGALDELAGEGVLEARERQGFFVKSERRRERARATRLEDLASDRVAHGMATILVHDDDFLTIGCGTAAESLLATPEWTAALKGAPPRDPRTSLRYADPKGEPLLREVIAARFGGAEEPGRRVIVCHGAVEGLNIAFAECAARTGSRRVAVESPGYFMLGPILQALGLEVVAIPRTPEGLDVDALRREARRAPLAALMVNPNHQNPVGHTLSLAQRFEVAKLAQDRDFWIIEDDVYRGLWIDEPEPPTIRSLLPDRTLYVGSFSKTLGPALRVGFIVAPDALVEALLRRRFLGSLSGDSYTQRLVADFVDRRGYQRHLVEVREELSRRARIAAHQAAAFPELGRFAGPYTGGLFWRFELAPGLDAMALYRAARAANVLVSPGWFFRSDAEPGAAADAWMRVNVSCCEGTTLTRALEVLRAAAS